MAHTKFFWIGVSGTLFLLLAIANLATVAWRWGQPYLLGDPLSGLPRVFLWVWERPENLEFLDPQEAGVAILAKTLILEGNRIAARPRLRPVRLPQGIPALAVIRIEAKAAHPDLQVRKEAVRQILDCAASSTAGIQIDFDALVSDRDFYRALLADLRLQLPPGRKLSITALASWCLYDDWISCLPVDEAIPMLFRMGVDHAAVKRYLGAGYGFRVPQSRYSLGISTDEFPGSLPANRRIYLFSPQPWTKDSVADALRRVREMQ